MFPSPSLIPLGSLRRGAGPGGADQQGAAPPGADGRAGRRRLSLQHCGPTASLEGAAQGTRTLFNTYHRSGAQAACSFSDEVGLP